MEEDYTQHPSWLQAKVEAQKVALDRLHTRVVNQRFQLRVLNELGRGLSREEFLKAKETVENEETRKRIGDPE
jgi:hypothetical protein